MKTTVEFDLSGARDAGPAPTAPTPDGKRTVGDWARAKGHDAFEFNQKRAAERRGLRRGDRHKGPDVEVIRAHMHPKWRADWRQVGDTFVTEAEYDDAARAAYSVAAAGMTHPAPAMLLPPGVTVEAVYQTLGTSLIADQIAATLTLPATAATVCTLPEEGSPADELLEAKPPDNPAMQTPSASEEES